MLTIDLVALFRHQRVPLGDLQIACDHRLIPCTHGILLLQMELRQICAFWPVKPLINAVRTMPPSGRVRLYDSNSVSQ
jgi:hypothetical protein